MKQGSDLSRFRGDGQIAFRGQSSHDRGRAFSGALLGIRDAKHVFRAGAAPLGKKAFFRQHPPHFPPLDRQQLPAPGGKFPFPDRPPGPGTRCPPGQFFRRLGGRAHAVTAEHHKPEQTAVFRNIAPESRRLGVTRGSGKRQKKNAEHLEHGILSLHGAVYGPPCPRQDTLRLLPLQSRIREA